MFFAKIAQTLISNKGERETDRGTPQVKMATGTNPLGFAIPNPCPLI